MGRFGTVKSPVPVVTVLYSALVSVFLTDTAAFSMTAPVVSLTRPRRVARSPCAKSGRDPVRSMAMQIASSGVVDNMVPSKPPELSFPLRVERILSQVAEPRVEARKDSRGHWGSACQGVPRLRLPIGAA